MPLRNSIENYRIAVNFFLLIIVLYTRLNALQLFAAVENLIYLNDELIEKPEGKNISYVKQNVLQ